MTARPAVGRLVVALALLVGAQGCSSDEFARSTALFESYSVEAGGELTCDEGEVCVRVGGPVVGSKPGVGRCRLHGPGDPDVQAPLAESEDLRLVPGEETWWSVRVTGGFLVSDLNPVCEPVIEG